MVDALLQDIRYAARLFRRNPLFTVAAASSVALGIGMNAAVFSVTEAALLRSWAAREPDSLVRITATTPRAKIQVSRIRTTRISSAGPMRSKEFGPTRATQKPCVPDQNHSGCWTTRYRPTVLTCSGSAPRAAVRSPREMSLVNRSCD
jgi:hypothetical protein